MVVPQAAGGNTDLIGRMVGEHLNRAWNVSAIIDNRGGAGGNIGNEIVARAAPDGYTLLVASPALVTSPALYSKLSYDATKDFAPIGIAALVPQVLVVHPSVPAKSVKDLLELARQKPGSLNYAAPGAGSGPHVASALFVSMAKVKIEHIAYKGTGPAITDLLAGQVQMQFGGLPALMPRNMPHWAHVTSDDENILLQVHTPVLGSAANRKALVSPEEHVGPIPTVYNMTPWAAEEIMQVEEKFAGAMRQA
ncbi:MAG: tripartite tricarboxylate transporter substrate-binding protein [Proteobacteria bacterium]|nr:tripartite tricarboxylate transporter substrate-binding protein [Pseudomonadota bacterium]